MKIFIEKDYDAMSDRALSLFLKFLPQIKILGLATGKTPLGFYRRLVESSEKHELRWQDIHTFNLDEYFGIPPDTAESFRQFMVENLFSKLGIPNKNTHFPPSLGDPEKAVSAYNSEIDAIGHPDFQLLGIGRNGHIAFNEPGSPRSARTRIVLLSEDTVKSNKPPTEFAITMGLDDILKSHRVLLLASGLDKAMAVASMVDGPLTYKVPASYLQEHPECYVVLDEDAASGLDRNLITRHYRRMENFSYSEYSSDL